MVHYLRAGGPEDDDTIPKGMVGLKGMVQYLRAGGPKDDDTIPEGWWA